MQLLRYGSGPFFFLILSLHILSPLEIDIFGFGAINKLFQLKSIFHEYCSNRKFQREQLTRERERGRGGREGEREREGESERRKEKTLLPKPPRKYFRFILSLNTS